MRTPFSISLAYMAMMLAAASNIASAQADKPVDDGVLGKQTTQNPSEFTYLDNGQVRIGVKKGSGAGIAWFSLSGSDRNLINHWDHGRLIQQSYYGQEDGSVWVGNKWRWNPVQGGDTKGNPAKLLELKEENNTLYAKTQPKHWATGEDLPDVTMEEWISLEGKIAHVRFSMTYKGTVSHPKTGHEIPAFFVQPDLETLVLYNGDKPWTGGDLNRSTPGWPNESRDITENWAAYVDKDNFGVGAYVPVSNHITCYRYGDGIAEHGACSYFAPLTEFAITPGTVFAYDLYLTIGTAEEIRAAFKAIHDKAHATN